MNIDLWKKRKKELKLTHDQLAEISGISRRTIAGIFGGDPKYTSPTYNTIVSIEKALGINGLTAEEYEQGLRLTKQVSITADDEDILDKFHEVQEKLGDNGKNLIIDFCNVLIENFK